VGEEANRLFDGSALLSGASAESVAADPDRANRAKTPDAPLCGRALPS